jgi:signal transduction histidine kinase
VAVTRVGRAGVGRRVATWLLLVGSVLAAAAFTVDRLASASDGGGIGFYDEAWSDDGVRVTALDPGAAGAGGLEVDDLVRSIDGTTMDEWLALVADPGAARPDGVDVPYVVDRGDATVRPAISWGEPDVGVAIATTWSVALLSIAIAAIAGYVFARRPDLPASTALVIGAVGIAGSSVPWALGTTTSGITLGGPFVLLVVLTVGLYMVTWPAAIHMALVFPRPLRAVERHPGLVPAVYAIALGGYGLGLAASLATSTSTLAWIGSWPRIQLVVLISCLAAFLGLFAWRYRNEDQPEERRRSRWAAGAALLSVILGLVLFQIPELVLGRSLLPASWIGLVALPIPIGLAMAILRDHLFGIDVVVNRTLVYGMLTAGVFAIYLTASAVLRWIVGDDAGYGGILLATGAAVLLALPVRDRLQRAVDRLMYGDPRHAELVRQRESLVVAREEERRRLRRDLHDGLGPTLAAVGLRAETAAAQLDAGSVADAQVSLSELSREVEMAMTDVRRLVDGLRPPALDELGLVGAIDQQVRRLEGMRQDGRALQISVASTGSDGLRSLPAAIEVAAYRIAVEAVTNAVRHADADRCDVRIDAGDTLRIEVSDDGRGLAGDARAGTGLESMTARATEVGGHLDLERAPEGGTRVVAVLPLAPGSSA